MKTGIFLLAVLIAVASGCSKKDSSPGPVANFTYSGANTFAPAPVYFDNNSTNASSYVWDFGDSSKSTASNPTHTFAEGGVYTVTLTATGAGGSNSISKTVSIDNRITSALITNVKVLAMPFTNSSGVPYDLEDGPDLYFQIKNSAGTVVYTSTPVVDNVTPSQIPYAWSLDAPLIIRNLTSEYTIAIVDYDPLDNDDVIGGGQYRFTMEPYMATHHDSIVLNNSATIVKLELGVKWQ